ncbi:hypothetical protein [Sphingomonas sp. AP4-R1]|uniref:hypothetical protein n=1 Tax=Sphingomonas sp. AP4-R1 TaxID=2735134 RepID=UPI001C11E703|nr:hypothetical protein [Sphingomonas sp. AP4-R1]
MLKSNVEGDEKSGEVGKAATLRLGYDPDREPELSFETSWIQDKSNQLVKLDTFFGALELGASLCLFYAKKTPLSESAGRVIIGAARVSLPELPRWRRRRCTRARGCGGLRQPLLHRQRAMDAPGH